MTEKIETSLSHLGPIIRHQYHNTVYQSKENDREFLFDLRALADKSTLLVNPFSKSGIILDSTAFPEEIINEIALKAEIH